MLIRLRGKFSYGQQAEGPVFREKRHGAGI